MKTHPSHPMALPSRLALWVGVAFFVGAFVGHHIFLAGVGCIFIFGGVFLWLRYHPNPLRLPSFSFLSKFKKFKKVSNKTSQQSIREGSQEELQRLKEEGKKALKELTKATKKLD